MELTKEQIEKINKECPSDQGVFFQPSYVPVDVKELVIYGRFQTGGYSGGNCFDGEAKFYVEDEPKDRFQVLDLVLAELIPNISYLQYKKISVLIHTNEETEREYYGNSTEWKCEYIVLSELYKLLETF